MKITFLGTGEACDPNHLNTSVLLNDEGRESIMLDCGFSTPHRYFSLCDDADQLAGIWISHLHGDHYFGLPLILLRFWEMGRTKPLIVAGHIGLQEKVSSLFEYAYEGFWHTLGYPIEFQEVSPGDSNEIAGYTYRSAENDHSLLCLAVRFEDGEKSVFYSGDGRPTFITGQLAKECNLVIHEAFYYDKVSDSHGNILECMDFARQVKAKNLALVHLNRLERKARIQDLQQVIVKTIDFNVYIPKDGDVIEI